MILNKKKWNIKVGTDKKKKKIPKRFWVYLVLLILCIVGVIYILRLPQYQISKVSVEGDVLTKESEVSGIVNGYLAQKYFYFVPKSNVWLYPKDEMLEKIKSLSSVEDIDIKLNKDNKELNIIVKERKNEFVWCDASNKCYYMDRDGYIFANAPVFEGNVFLTFRGQIEGEPIGKQFLSQDKMLGLVTFVSDLSKLDLKINSINIISEREVRLTTDSKTDIIISLERPLGEVISNIETLIHSNDFINASGGTDNLEYLDLRYGKKAFWK